MSPREPVDCPLMGRRSLYDLGSYKASTASAWIPNNAETSFTHIARTGHYLSASFTAHRRAGSDILHDHIDKPLGGKICIRATCMANADNVIGLCWVRSCGSSP